MHVCVYPVFVLFCLDSGLATGWSPVQRVLQTVDGIKKLKKAGKVQRAAQPLREREVSRLNHCSASLRNLICLHNGRQAYSESNYCSCLRERPKRELTIYCFLPFYTDIMKPVVRAIFPRPSVFYGASSRNTIQSCGWEKRS
jgi:hypothetical protein